MDLKLGDKLTLNIHDIAFGGEGVGRVEEFVVFVPFVIVGEEAEVEITEVKKNFARAKLLRVVKASPQRVAAECKHFAACGGCQYQHIEYAAQLRVQAQADRRLVRAFRKNLGANWSRRSIPCPSALRLSQPYHDPQPVEQARAKKLEHRLSSAQTTISWWTSRSARSPSRRLNEQIKEVRANPPPKGGHQGRAARPAGKLGGAARVHSSRTIFSCCRSSSRR